MTDRSITSFIFTARSDSAFIDYTLPSLISMCTRGKCSATVVIDTKIPSGVLASSLAQPNLEELSQKLKKLQKSHPFKIKAVSYEPKEIKEVNKFQFGHDYSETHCFRGYPIYGSCKQFLETDSKYVLHLDSDMFFYEAPGFSWIQEGVRVMEENDNILCVLPRGGPPTHDSSLNQGTTHYEIDKKRGLYLFKNFTSRHYLIHRERILNLLPMKPVWLSWREPIKSRLFGNGKMLCWETMVEQAVEKSSFWRADLMTDQAWSLHPGDRSQLFHRMLPQILSRVGKNQFPEGQRGHFDLQLEKWSLFLNQNN